MDLKLSSMLNRIMLALEERHQRGALYWADQKFPGRLDGVINQFDEAITAAQETKDWVTLQRYANVYESAMVKIFEEYAKEHGVNQVKTVLSALYAESKKTKTALESVNEQQSGHDIRRKE